MKMRSCVFGQKALFLWVCAFVFVSFVALAPRSAHSQGRPSSAAEREAIDLTFFEKKAALSKELGATHMLVTEGLPVATWEMDATDPYPMWFVHHAGMLTIFPPSELRRFVDAQYVAETARVLKERCRIMSKYGLKGVWSANEPAVLPEGFFTAHPSLRGPRIDQPNRSRKVYFAPNVDAPEVLAMYRDAMQQMLATCPAVDQVNWVTTDAGSGFDWAPSLYPGVNGNTNVQNRPLSDRVAGFLINAQKAARDAGKDVQINLTPIEPRPWMVPTFSADVLENTVRKLPRGLAVEGHEGPDGRKFAGVATLGVPAAFYPVMGVVVPPFEGAGLPGKDHPARFMVNFGDSTTVDFNFRLLRFTDIKPMSTLAERTATLRAFAATEATEVEADNLVQVWASLNEVQRVLQVLNFGDVLRFGHVLNRWITRPMVPFPEELSEAEKKDYRPFLLQAKGEVQAEDLADIQAMRPYEGWGARLLFQNDIEIARPHMMRAIALVNSLEGATHDAGERQRWSLLSRRLQAVMDLLQSAEDMVCYQAQLDRVKALDRKPEANPVLGVASSWDRTDLVELARREVDTMVDLEQLLASMSEPILDVAPSAATESIMRLGPNVGAQIKHKIDIMNAHWRDYDRLFTMPNP